MPRSRRQAASYTPEAWQSFLAERERVAAGIFGRCRVMPSGCWEMSGDLLSNGYSRVTIGTGDAKRKYLAHRLMYTLLNGKIPQNAVVCHICDNPPCVNPMHLALGASAQINSMDMAAKGRGRRQKLTDDKVIEIRRRSAAGECHSHLAEEYQVCQATIRNVLGKTWKHLQRATMGGPA